MSTVLSPPARQTVADLLETLGNVPADRVRMQPLPGMATVADVISIHAKEKRLCELVDGVLVEKATGFPEARLTFELIGLLREYLKKSPIGIGLSDSGMMQLFEGLVRIPDASVVLWARFPNGQPPQEQVPLLAPDLAVDVLSQSNTEAEMARKRQEYFDAGSSVVWIVDPRTRTVAVYTSTVDFTVLNESDVLDGGEVLPGLQVPLQELFATLDSHG